MNARLLFSLFFVIQFFSLSAQFTWSNPQPAGFNNRKVIFTDPSTGYIINDNGDLVNTTNAGASWKIKRNFPRCNTMDVLDSVLVVAGGDTIAYISTDKGETWSTSFIRPNSYVSKVEFISKDTIFMTGQTTGLNNTQLFQSVNRGKTWEVLNTNIIVKSVDFVNSTLGFATSYGGIFKTVDGGKSWQNVYAQTSGYSFITIAFRDQNTGFAYQQSGSLFKTTDGGATWSVSKPYSGSDIYFITFANATTNFVGGEGGQIYRSTDNGSTWEYKGPINTFDRYSIYSMYFAHDSLAFATGIRGRILKTTNFGESYQEYSPTYTDIKALAFPTGSVGYAASWTELFKTVDSGKTWGKVPFLLSLPQSGPGRFQHLHFFSRDTGIASAESPAQLYKTYNGGQSWKMLTIPVFYKDHIQGLFFINNTGYLNIEGGGGYTTLQSKDRGETWEVRSTGQQAGYSNFHFIDEKTGYANIGSMLYQTMDSAKTWQYVMYNGNTINSISFPDAATGYVGGNDGYNSRSVDSGKTWSRMSIYPDNYNFYDVYAIRFFNKKVGYLVSKSGGIYKTINAGKNWHPAYTPPWDLQTIEMTSDTSVFVAGTYGAILKEDMCEYSIDSLKVVSASSCSAGVSASITTVLATVDSIWFEYGTNGFSRAIKATPFKITDTTQKVAVLLKDVSADSTYKVRVKVYYRGNYHYSNSTGFKPTALPRPTITSVGDTILKSSVSSNYQWYLNNNKLATDTLNSIKVKKVGFYRVETSPDKTCWDASEEYPVLVLKGRLSDTLKVGIYPNPAVGMFNVVITLPNISSVVASVTVVNTVGNVVLQTEKLFFYSNQIKIPITLNATGVFNVKVTINGEVKTQTVILQ